MGVVISQFTNPWGQAASYDTGAAVGLQPARPDLWQLDLRTVATVMPGYLQTAYQVESGFDSFAGTAGMYQVIKTSLPSPSLATYLARSVTLPKRVTGVGALVRRDNGAFEAPGYAQNIGRVEMTFVHELAANYGNSAIWALLTVWRAFARAGYGPDFPNTPELNFGLTAASAAGGNGLNSPYRQDFSVTLLTPVTGDDEGGMLQENGTSLGQGPSYTVKNAWPADFGLETLSYENGRTVLELRASFQCDDVVPETGNAIAQGPAGNPFIPANAPSNGLF